MAGFGVDRGSGSSAGNPDSAISEALIDAKGDLIVGTADNTAARLAVGADETRLVAASGESTGLKWVADSVNYLIAAAGDLIYGTAADTAARLAIGAAKRRLAVNSGATAPEWVADTQNTVADAKGDLLVATAADTITALTVGTNDQVLIADSTQATGLRWGDAPTSTSPHRQTQLSGELDSSGYNATLSAGAGLNYNINAVDSDAIFSFAGGFNAAGASDLVTVLSADASNQGSLNASNTHYIHATRTSSTAVTWGQALIPPQYGYAFDRTEGALLNFEAADASTTMVDDFGNTWTAAGNAQIDTAQSKFGSSSLLLDGTGDYISCTGVATLGSGSWELSGWFRANALPGTFADLFSFTNAAGYGVRCYLDSAGKLNGQISSNGTSANVMSALGTTVLSTATWYKIRIVFDALGGTYKIYLSNNGAAESTEASASSTARVCAMTDCRVGAAYNNTLYFNGWVDAVRLIRCATATSAETPGASAPAITDYPVHFFSIPEMKMYEVTAASASAGTNPTLTARTRLFVGECDTNGSAVTATRNYALRGMFKSAQAALLAANTQASHSPNIGTVRVRARMVAVNVTAESSFTPGQEQELLSSSNSGGNQFYVPAVAITGRNTATVRSGDLGGWASIGAASVVYTMTAASWKYYIVVERDF